MNYVYGRSMVVLDTVSDRMRLKDKIVANVAKAVKSIQELQILSPSGSLTLGNYDWQCHRLCEHLDHTLLHGLRHVTPGYWKIVSEFTHKDCVKEIKRMRNVTTDLGRGRAWLFMALNECLLESYLRCYQQNESLVENYYVRDALVRDQDKFNVLLTVISGLENIEFQLECDMPYLDLCVYPPNSKRVSNVESTVDFDRLSVCSMESVYIPASKPLPQAVFEKGESSVVADKDRCSTGSREEKHSPSLDSGIHSDWNYRQRSITPIDQMSVSSTSQDSGNSKEAGLEVIHLSKKGKPQKHKKKKKKFVSVSSMSEPDVIEVSENVAGPVIEIPPLDDVKLLGAIMNSQNNNEVDSLHCLHPDFSAVSIPRVRSPGDGMENETDKVDGTLSDSKHKTAASKEEIGDTVALVTHNDSNQKINTSHIYALSDTENETSVTETSKTEKDRNKGSPGIEVAPSSDKGIFTKLIEAKVSHIISAGDQLEHAERNTEHKEKEYKDVFEFSEDANEPVSYYKDLYNGESVEDEPVVKISQCVSDKSIEDIPEVPSIYSRTEDSDLSNDEDTESFSQTFMPTAMKKRMSQNNTPCRKSNSSTPVSDVKAFTNVSEHKQTPEDMDKISVSSEKGIHGIQRSMKSPHSDSSLYGRISNRSTPDIVSANQIRSKSVMSYSSANETEDEQIANRMLPTSRASSSLSANEQRLYRNSPCPSTDDDKLSINTHSSTQSPSTDMEASGQVLQAKVEQLIEQKKLNQYTHLTFGDDCDDEEDIVQLPSPLRERAASRAGEVELDNNTMLYLMLDVLNEDETIVKMFCCQQGHTEGKTKTVLFLITLESVYILQPLPGKKKFSKLAVIAFKDIDFVSIGFNNQILHIACKNKRRKYCLTPGEERITIAIVECLADSMKKSDSKPGRLEVDTGNTVQKISLQKYISTECKCEQEDAEVICYSLVHWEDPTSDKGSCEWDREGILYYKCIETANILGTQTWRLAYASLRDSMLCLYNDKNDAKPSHFLSMGGGQCVGCKRDFNCDKNHAVKVMLSDGTFWSIALDSEEEANRWLQGLCQAVSEGMKMSAARASCVPCCMVLSKQKLLMCHEDFDTNFIRTLGSANLQDITAVLYDELNKSYLVLVFESDEETVSSEKWVLYFNSDHECNRFKTALSDCWFRHFQVELQVNPVDDFSLQKKCTEMVQHLKSSHSLDHR